MKKLAQTIIMALSLAMPVAQASAQDAAAYTPLQLDLMLAPIALYPDPLLLQVLAASAYPTQVTAAAAWQANTDMSQWPAGRVADTLQRQNWDSSVKALLAFPGVLQALADNPDWIQPLAFAFQNQPADVMGAVQDLRTHATQTGYLQTNAQQVVSMQGADILIEPADPDHIYVPTYDPNTVYGPWQAGYQPYILTHASDGTRNPAPTFYVTVIQYYWGQYKYDWHNRRIVHNSGFSPDHPAPNRQGVLGDSTNVPHSGQQQTSTPHTPSAPVMEQPQQQTAEPPSQKPELPKQLVQTTPPVPATTEHAPALLGGPVPTPLPGTTRELPSALQQPLPDTKNIENH